MRGCCWGANRAVQSHCYDSTHPQGLHYTLPITYTAPWRHAAQVLLNGALEIKFKQMLVMNYSKCVCVWCVRTGSSSHWYEAAILIEHLLWISLLLWALMIIFALGFLCRWSFGSCVTLPTLGILKLSSHIGIMSKEPRRGWNHNTDFEKTKIMRMAKLCLCY